MIIPRLILITILFYICNFSNTESKEALSDNPEMCDNYYRIHLAKVSWFHALHACRREGADLATIMDDNQLSAISSHLMSIGYGANDWFWIGGNDLAKEGTFEWSSNGEKMSFGKWSHPQPDNAGGHENCVHLWLREGQFKMNDWLCDQGKTYFICQAPEPTTVTIW